MGPHNYTYLFEDGTASPEHTRLWAEEKAFAHKYLKENGRVRFTFSLCKLFLYWSRARNT